MKKLQNNIVKLIKAIRENQNASKKLFSQLKGKKIKADGEERDITQMDVLQWCAAAGLFNLEKALKARKAGKPNNDSRECGRIQSIISREWNKEENDELTSAQLFKRKFNSFAKWFDGLTAAQKKEVRQKLS